MKYLIDIKFTGSDETAEIISVRVIDENGRDFYAVSCEFDFFKAWNNQSSGFYERWILMQVWKILTCGKRRFDAGTLNKIIQDRGASKKAIAEGIKGFIDFDNPEFSADSYDIWNLFCQLMEEEESIYFSSNYQFYIAHPLKELPSFPSPLELLARTDSVGKTFLCWDANTTWLDLTKRNFDLNDFALNDRGFDTVGDAVEFLKIKLKAEGQNLPYFVRIAIEDFVSSNITI